MDGLGGFGKKLNIHITAVLLPAVLITLNAWYLLMLTVIAVTAHEMGHYAALRFKHCEIRRINFGLLGVSMRYADNLSYGGEVLCALAGPAANAVLAVASALTGRLFNFAPAYHLAGLCVILCVFNLLPVYPLDGGRVLYNAYAYLFGPDAAERVVFAVKCAVLAGLLLLGVLIVTMPSHNPTLLICAFLAAVQRE